YRRRARIHPLLSLAGRRFGFFLRHGDLHRSLSDPWNFRRNPPRIPRLFAYDGTSAQEIFPTRSFVILLQGAPAAHRIGVNAIAPTLEKRALDMMFGDKSGDLFPNCLRHGNRFDEIGTGFGHRFALRWISRYEK